MPARFRSMPVMPAKSSCSDLPASSSRCARVMRIVRVEPSSRRKLDMAGADDRALELADLIALRQVGIEVVLAIEDAACADVRVDCRRRTSPPFARRPRSAPATCPATRCRQRSPACSVLRRIQCWRRRKSSSASRAARGLSRPMTRFPLHCRPTRWPAAYAMPIGRALKIRAERDQATLAEMRPDQLHADRQTIVKSARQRERWNAGEAGRNGEYVLLIHLDRIADLADRKCGARRGRRQQGIDRSRTR